MKVFISHSSTDKAFVRKLKVDLNENDIDTWVDEDELDIGDSLLEKLETALEGSSHFLIVLSKASVRSEWVQKELDKALQQSNSNLLQKIIPVKYKECDVPNVIKDLIYSDLSKEVREVTRGDQLHFTTDGYSDFLESLCRSIRNSEKVLSGVDKIKIKKDMATDQLQESSSLTSNIVRASYKVIGYRSTETHQAYARNILSKSNLNINDIRPILLPPLLKNVLGKIELGDLITFTKNFRSNEVGHFGGFRKDDLGIAIDHQIRKALELRKGFRFTVEIELLERRLNFISRI